MKIMNTKFTKIALAVSMFATLSTGAFAQSRVIEDSLVYDDPTVAKPNSWLYGLSVDYNNTTANAAATDTQGNVNYQKTVSSTVGASAFAGYGNFTLMGTYTPGRSTASVPAYAVTINQTSWTGDLTLRWLVMDLQTRYFVPYLLGSYMKAGGTDSMNVYVNGVQEINKYTAQGPGVGFGGIIPLTEKYGFRADVRDYFAKVNTTSNVFPQYFNSNKNIQYIRSTLTGYYNFTDSINLQIGVQNSFTKNQSMSSATGFYTKLGYTFD